MDDLASIKVVGVLSTIFLFSLTVSNYLSKEFGLVKSPVFSLKIFSTSFVLLYFTFLFVAAKKFDTVLPSRTHSKGYFFISSLLKWFVGALAFHCGAVIYGAALFNYVEETFVWSVMMSTLVILPLLLTEVEEIPFILQGERKTVDLTSCMCGIVIFTLLGAWFGAFTLPLDWDREWQVWPIPCAIGAISGHFISLLLSALLLFWTYVQRNKNKIV
ncbi:phosphatidylinositol-glycan biosynthesis class F protein-like [Xenia sp. Carnegie-2017]|uniref:phosphatidylinositol-glycan biosynthesis class F protein-like n=1 Tax=Xenia sp. Carnegie-2017 TaxID=2897299 RepID=UPI001F046636|nr:phosphatidylinositol-glycan biosynthesis class F protein-like [Xenia sp. Carnegie-2017]